MKRCIIIGAGPKALHPFVKNPGDLVIAADGGYSALKTLGVKADYIIGDFDSLVSIPDEKNTIVLPKEKDDTDMMAAIRLGLKEGCSEFLLYNAMGGRFDHTLANLQCLAFIRKNGARGCLFDRSHMLTIIEDEQVSLTGGNGTVSVFAYGGNAQGVEISGLYYEAENVLITPDFPIGVSNELTGAPAKIRVRKGRLLLCVPLDCTLGFDKAEGDRL